MLFVSSASSADIAAVAAVAAGTAAVTAVVAASTAAAAAVAAVSASAAVAATTRCVFPPSLLLLNNTRKNARVYAKMVAAVVSAGAPTQEYTCRYSSSMMHRRVDYCRH